MYKEPRIHAGHVELAVVMLLNYRAYTIVPNVCWHFAHECDLLAIDDQRRLTEIEIKVSASDLRADFNKKPWHESDMISRLVFAVPASLVALCEKLLPSKVGIISVKWNGRGFFAEWHRQCRHDKAKQPITEKQALQLTRLGCMRIWSLKKHNHKTELLPVDKNGVTT